MVVNPTALLRARTSSALSYLALFLLAAVVCEARSGFLELFGWIVFVPYASVSLFAALTAFLIGGWYGDGSWGEVLLVPIIVILVAVTLAGGVFAVISLWTGEGLSFPGDMRVADIVADIVAAAMASGFYFLYFAWPALLIGSVVVSVGLLQYCRARQMPPNNALERPNEF